MGERAPRDDGLDARGMRFAIVVARYNHDVTERLLEGARRTLAALGAEDVSEAWVPGAFELPLAAQRIARSGRADAVVCLGAVIRGDTPHFDYVAGECARGLMRVALDTDVPVVFGVLTTETRAQALDRAGGSAGHKGEEAAATAVEMVSLLRELP